jgi:hypothetical protein
MMPSLKALGIPINSAESFHARVAEGDMNA